MLACWPHMVWMELTSHLRGIPLLCIVTNPAASESSSRLQINDWILLKIMAYPPIIQTNKLSNICSGIPQRCAVDSDSSNISLQIQTDVLGDGTEVTGNLLDWPCSKFYCPVFLSSLLNLHCSYFREAALNNSNI